MQGLLTGKFATPDQVPDDRARTRHYPSSRSQARHNESGAEEETFAAVAKIQQIADELNEPMAHVTIAWLLAQEGVTSVIVGGRNPDQVRSNVQAAGLQLPKDAVAALSSATEPLKRTLGSNADMWQSTSRIR
jgi:aryl-alcohol dehydrogenase-like predicted oxidoreductase